MKRQTYKKSILFSGVLFLGACSAISDLNFADLNSLSGNLATEAAPAELTKSRVEGVSGLAKAATLSNEEVAQIASSYSKVQDSKHKLAEESNPYAIRLNKLVKNHIKEDSLNLNFKVYLSPEANAFAMADGTIRVYSGLMDLMKDDELLSIIGHEIGHVKLQHSKNQLQKAYIANSVLSSGAGELQSGMGNGLGGQLKKAGIDQAEVVLKELASAQFSQSDEEAADDYSLKFLQKHGYSADAGIRALRKLESLENDDNSSVIKGLFSSHPASARRAQRLANKLGKNDDTTVIADSSSLKSKENIQLPQKSETVVRNSSNASKKWYVQVKAAEDKQTAIRTLNSFIRQGYTGDIREVVVKGTLYFRVLIGPFANSNQAKTSLPTIERLGLSDGEPILRRM